MLDDTLRPLSRQRLEQIVRGLQSRFSSSAASVVQDVQQLNCQLEALARGHAEEQTAIETARRNQREATTNAWDEALLSHWDDAELRSYRAVHDTSMRQGQLRRDARKRIEELTAELKQRGAELEKAFLRAKDAPLARLNNFRSQNQALADELQGIQQATEAVFVQRSLPLPQVAPLPMQRASVRNSDEAMQTLRQALLEARNAGARFANHPVARFFESPLWWAICALLFGLVTVVLGASDAVNWLAAVLAGAVVMVTALLLSLIGVRPWLKQQAAAEYPKFLGLLQLARSSFDEGNRMAVAENEAELKRLAAWRDQQFEQAKQARERDVAQLTEQLERDLAQLTASATLEKQLAAAQLSQSLASCDGNFSQRLQTEWQQFADRRGLVSQQVARQESEVRHQIEQLQRLGAQRQQQAVHKVQLWVDRSQAWCRRHFPAWEQLRSSDTPWPPAVERPLFNLGNIDLRLLILSSADSDHQYDEQLSAPLLFSPLEDGYLAIKWDSTSPMSAQFLRNLIMRALTSLPAGRAQICVVDPLGLGRDFGWLMHLGDFDPQLVWHRVWTQSAHISKQLADLALAAEDFIQQSLRNQYRDIVAYNADAGSLAEPFRLLVWAGFPHGLDDHALPALRSLLDSGARCGIIPILLMDSAWSGAAPELREMVDRRGLHLTYDTDSRSLRAVTIPLTQFPVAVETPADEAQASDIVQAVGRRALKASRVEVPLSRLLSPEHDRWTGDSSTALEIPIGQSGVGRTHALRLGQGTAQHAIIAGKTGSGKSSLLHALITSSVMKYPPSQLRLVLLDFKKGVEFQVYAEAGLPHADIIGIESHREFGLSALQYVDGCLQRRGEAFRQASVQDVASWNVRYPHQPMPRMLVVIDEFQELFVEDDKLSSQASLILDRIVRQGRSFGIHAVLSSQTLAGAYSLPRTTLGQMAVRIALQCDAADAQMIFADDNPAALRLKFPGQAIYNDAGGRVEGNQPMQIGWIGKSEQVAWLQQLPGGYQNADTTTNLLGRCVVYDGNRAAHWDLSNAEIALDHARREVNPEALWCVVGESVAINPAVVFPLTPQAGRNALLVGGEDQAAAPVLTAMVSSLVHARAALRSAHESELASAQQAIDQTPASSAWPQVYVLQGAKPTDSWTLKLPQLWQELPVDLHVADARGVDELLAKVHANLQQRMNWASQTDSAETSPPPPALLLALQLGRLRSLRREQDDFGMGGFGDATLKPDKMLEEILRDGPSHGLHTIIWAENYSTVQRWLSRAALRELEIRLLMRMSGNDSTNLIDSVAASRLEQQVMLIYDEATGQEQRFRPFATDALPQITRWQPGTA